MKKKSLLFIFASLFCLILFGCRTTEPYIHRRYFLFFLRSLDGSSIFSYGSSMYDTYALKENQTYELYFQHNGPWELFPESIVMEYDDTIFEIVCLTTPESEEYGCNVFYHLTCLKKFDSASFVVYPQGHHSDTDDPCRYKFIFKVE